MNNPTLKSIESFPKQLPKNCGDGLAKLYDECSNQNTILQAAIQAAQMHHKNVLIIYGAEWCIWCHVFDKYIRGQVKKL
ncbi:MAG: DUF255 domain-containing protein [Pasteurellaceae bacterium]|nr:DUF255 domain-containing protein [Pasteurellaceae bacterium]